MDKDNRIGLDPWVLYPNKSVASAPPLEPGGFNSPVQLEEQREVQIFQKSTRKDFVAKLYAVILVQSIFIMVAELSSTLLVEVQSLIKDFIWVLIPCFTSITCLAFLFLCVSRPIRRSYPLNLVLLMIMTLGFAGLASVGAAAFQEEPVILATVIPMVFSVAIIAFTKILPWDVTGCAMIVGNILAGIISLIFVIGVHVFFLPAFILHLIAVMLGGMVFFFWMIYDTQAILAVLRGNMGPTDYILASIHLHVDILLVFFHSVCKLRY